MKILAVQASPRHNGNTALLLEHYLKGVREKYPQAEIQTVYLHGKNIEPCRGCNRCKEERCGCVIRDDMQDLYQKFHRAEVLIFATPVYWWNITSQLKRFMDRLYAIDVESGFKNKKFVLLLTYGGALPNSGPELVQRTFKEICDYVHMDFVQFYGTCTDDYKPVEENQEAQEAVYEMGKAL